MTLFGIQDTFECPPLQLEHPDAVALQVDPRRIANDVNEPVERMEAAKQIIVLAVAPEKEPREIVEANPFEAFYAFEALERVRFLRVMRSTRISRSSPVPRPVVTEKVSTSQNGRPR